MAARRVSARDDLGRQERIAANAIVRWDDVAIDAASDAVKFRREMEAAFAR